MGEPESPRKPGQSPSPSSESSEVGRAFLQARVALYWKVLCFVFLLASGLGALSAVKKPGVDLVLTMSVAIVAGGLWWLCSRGERSIRFSRGVETFGLLFTLTVGAFISRYVASGFVRDHGLSTAQAIVMADGYMSMVPLGAVAIKLALRAATIPTPPRRTLILTAALGIPLILLTATTVPAADGGLAWRARDSGALPWLPATMVMMWGFAVATSTVISWVMYGLRVEASEARRLGQYVLEAKLGEGGMGEVYRAHHGMMRRPTAIKLLRPERTSEIDLKRFEREAQLTARLTHRNTITLFDYGRTADGVFYYAMELLDGATLSQIVAACGPQPPARVVRILSMVCGALAEAHAIGLIHRDIKPANIMLCTRGAEPDVVKLLDFGLVKEFQVDQDVELTGERALLGTPQYMAPESIRDPGSVDARTDLYALGAVAYYLLAGVEVFHAKSLVELCGQHLHQQPRPLSGVPDELAAIVLACLEKDPDRRPQSADELRRRLDACPLERWDDERARAWWREHQHELDAHGPQDLGLARTIAVDAAHRAS